MSGMDLKIEVIRSGARQFEVARRARLHPIRLNRILNQRVKPRRDEVRAILNALGLEDQTTIEGGLPAILVN